MSSALASIEPEDLSEMEPLSEESEKEPGKERKPLINWGALLPRVASLISASLIVLFAAALFLAVAGALHPPIWETTQAVARPWWDQLMAWLARLQANIPP